MFNLSSPALKYCRRDGMMLWGSMWKWILGLDVIAYYMVNFILQIWKYLMNMYTFTSILLISMFLYAQAKITFFWSITQSQNIGETCQVFNKKVQSFSHTMQCKNCLINYHKKCINVDKTEVHIVSKLFFPTIILMMTMTFILQWLNVS